MQKSDILESIYRSSLTISEKRKYYNKNININNDSLTEWKQTKNLVTEEIFQEILDNNDMDEKEFNFCISSEDFPIEIENIDWITVLSDILDYYDEETIKKVKIKDTSISLFPFVQYVADKIMKLDWAKSKFKFSEEAIQDILTNYVLEVSVFIQKAIVVELYNYKQTHEFISSDEQQQFNEFIYYMFTNKENYYKFFSKYAVSTRLIAVRTLYFISNISNFINALIESEKEIKDLLNVKPAEIKHLHLSAGDSHGKGKSVIIIELGKDKIVYKPKNLDICKAYENFITWINNNSGLLELRTPKGVYKKEYAFIEFIGYKSCTATYQIKNFYERFGYTIALGYLLSMTDMHLENIVANEEYPYIVDGETILQNGIKLLKRNTVMNKFQTEYFLESIIMTAMLPNTAKIDNDLDLSALAGTEQKSKKKYLMPVKIGTSNFHYEDKEYIMPASNNIPMFDGQKVDYREYTYSIIHGFNRMIEFLYNKRDVLLSDESPFGYFKNKKIRYLAKSTQKYNELLGFLTHPTCCSQMKMRERTLQNIWAYPHYRKDIIKSEYQDMLFNDIPIFYTTTSDKFLCDSNGDKYNNYFKETGYEKIIRRAENLNEKAIIRQRDILLMHLGLYQNYKLTEFNRKRYTFKLAHFDLVFEAEEIAKKLLGSALIDENENISWPYVAIGKDSTIFSLTSVDLYEGLMGIALFFLELYHSTNKTLYFEYYKKCTRCCVIEFEKFPNVFSAYGLKYSIIYPILQELKFYGKSEFEMVLHKAIHCLNNVSKDDIKNSSTFSIDWINGISGLLALLINMLHTLTVLSSEEKTALEKISDTLFQIILNKLNEGDYTEDIGQAHGYSGIMLALSRYSNYTSDSSKKHIKNVVKTYLRKEHYLSRFKLEEQKDKWCHGLSGMIISRIEILKTFPDEELKRDLEELVEELVINQKTLYDGDSLCHGNSGTIIAIKACIENGLGNEKYLTDLYNNMLAQVMGEKTYTGNYKLLNTLIVENPTLFTGLSGVGYMLLKTKNYFDGNVLTLS